MIAWKYQYIAAYLEVTGGTSRTSGSPGARIEWAQRHFRVLVVGGMYSQSQQLALAWMKPRDEFYK
jgi:hypothetical protein